MSEPTNTRWQDRVDVKAIGLIVAILIVAASLVAFVQIRDREAAVPKYNSFILGGKEARRRVITPSRTSCCSTP